MKEDNKTSGNKWGNAMDFTELVFEQRFRDYGAYDVRTARPRNTLVGFTIGLIFIIILFLSPFLIFRFANGNETLKVTDRKVVPYSHLSAPPPIEAEKPPPPEFKAPPKKMEVKKFIPPTVKPDEEVLEDEELPTVEELKTSLTGPVAEEGSDSIVFDLDNEPEVVIEEGPPEPVREPEPFVVVEEMPVFPGGDLGLKKYLAENIRYPRQAVDLRIEGKVYIEFVIGTDGQVRNPRILRGIGSGCDEESIRVINEMPRWEPGRQRGKVVPVKFTIPIIFVLQ